MNAALRSGSSPPNRLVVDDTRLEARLPGTNGGSRTKTPSSGETGVATLASATGDDAREPGDANAGWSVESTNRSSSCNRLHAKIYAIETVLPRNTQS